MAVIVPGKRSRMPRPTRREFAVACVAASGALALPGRGFARAQPLPIVFEAIRFESRLDLDRAADVACARYRGAVLLDAIAATHVPELLVIRGEAGNFDLPASFAHPVYEVRRYGDLAAVRGRGAARGSGDPPPIGALHIPYAGGSITILGLASLAERAAAWDSAAAHESDCPFCEVGFYRRLAR